LAHGLRMASMHISRRGLVTGVGASIAGAACAKDATEAPTSATPKGPEAAPPKPGDPPKPAAKATGEVPKRKLGKTGVEVSMVGLGGFHIGKQKDPEESVRIIRAAVDRGITFLDNCWDYHEGASEERMGKALEGGYRQKAFLMSKLDGRTKDAAAKQIDQSLARLKTDVIDLMQIHEIIRATDPGRCFGAGGCMEALLEAKKAGKIRFIGFTGHKDPAIHLAMLKAADEHGFAFDTVQMPLNVLDAHWDSFEKEVLPVLVDKQIGVLGMKPLASGELMKSGKVTATECLHYAMSLPTSVVITGCETIEQLDQAVAAAVSFLPPAKSETESLLARTREIAAKGELEKYKTTGTHDGTTDNPHWLETANVKG
jgi:aryl-alcohol dehydrogenase-like predicted oxidoreductase